MKPRRPALALDTSLVQDQLPSEVMPKIFIGSIHSAFALEALNNLHITHILNVSRLPATFPGQFTYLLMDIRDKDDANFLSCIPASNIFIEAGTDAGGVLIHCFGGRSRSAALIAAFIMSSTRMDFDSTLALIRKARPVVNINRGFEAQLRAYSQSNYDVYVAQQILLRGRIRTLYSLHCEAQRSALSQSPIRDLIGNSGGSNNSSGRMPMRKRSKDFTNDEMLLKLVQDEKDALAEEELRGGHEEEEEEENYNYDRDQLRMKKAPSAQPVSLTNLRALIPLINAKTPNVRLTRPGSQAVRIIPPLRGLGREFCCSWCGKMLFNLANVIRLDVDAAPLVGLSASSAAESKEDLHRLSSRSSSGAVDPIFDGSGNIGLPLSSDNSPSLSDPAAKKTAAGLSSMRVPPPTSRYKQRKGFDFKDICANLPSYSSEDSELKSDSKGVDDEDENGGGVITTQRSYSDDKDHCADEALDKVSVHIPPQSSQQHSSVGRQSGRFVVTGPVDDDDTMSLASSQGGNSSIIIENSPPITRKNGKVFPLHLQLNSRSASPFNGLYSTRSMESEDSPRIPIPPHRMNEEFSPRQGPYWYRPQSAEKSRWLARVSLLQGGSISRVNSNSRVARMAQEDEEAVRLGWGGDKYVHLEYLEWMGQEALQGHKVKGPLHCSGCQNVLGVYDWSPNERRKYGGRVETPIFKLLKSVIHEAAITLDATPASTPRIEHDDSMDTS